MKRIIIAILVLTTGRLYAISPIGPAASILEQGQAESGFEYAYTKVDGLTFDATAEVFGLKVGGTVPLSDDMKACFLKAGYGLEDRGDIFLRLGAADVESTGTEFAWGLGGRITVVGSERLDWGLLAQVNWFGAEDAGTIRDETFGLVSYRGDLSFTVAQIAAGPVYKGDGFSVYGGPFVYWVKGDGDITVDDGTYSIRASVDAESDVKAGGYVGLSAAIRPNISINAEYQLADHSRAFACGLTWRY
ncbi:hypothetical protein ES705_13547 [subsurface metagenome]